MRINLDYLNNLNPGKLSILIEQISQSNNIEELKSIPKDKPCVYYYSQKRLFEIEGMPFKETEFVAIGNKQNKLIKVMVFEGKNSTNPYVKKISKLLKFDFDTIFDDLNFEGDSYNLALYIAAYALLHSKNIKENYCFSGVIDEALNITTPSFKEKQKFANSKNKIMLGENLSLHEILRETFYPDRKIILAKEEDLILPGFKVLKIGFLQKDDWTSIIKKTAKFIEPEDEIAFNCPSSFSFGLGAYLGSLYFYKVLHFQAGKYEQALITSRYLKAIDYNFNDLIISQPESQSSEYNILFHFASHEPLPPTQNPTIKIETKIKGNISSNDYEEITHQINNAINYLKREYKFEKVNLVFSMPVDMAFALGCAVGKFLNASIYHYFFESGSYFKVFDLNALG